jgi:nucleoside recognition membrane protein YjiH
MAFMTRFSVLLETFAVLFSTLETVAVETPARVATSSMVDSGCVAIVMKALTWNAEKARERVGK